MKKIIVFISAMLMVFAASFPTLAYSRTADAAVYADFDGENTELIAGSQAIPANTVTYLSGMGEDTKAYLSDGALKIELGRAGFVCLGSDNVKIRDAAGNVNYKYIVIRIKGEVGNENRTSMGGLLLFVGGGDGSHAITLNDRPTGTAPAALDANGKPMNAISTEWQEFAIALNNTNVRDKAECNGLNINTVSNAATIYIDDIYFSNTAPSTAAVYDPSTSTDAIVSKDDEQTSGDNSADNTDDNNATSSDDAKDEAEDTEISDGDVIEQAGVKRLDPPSREKSEVAPTQENSLGTVALIIAGVSVILLAAILTLIYVKVVLKNQ